MRTRVGANAYEFLFNQVGNRVAMLNGTTGAVLEQDAYWGALPLDYDLNGSLHFEHRDWIGTERITTSYNGSKEGGYASAPFGDRLSTSGTDLYLDLYHFAMLDHDVESGLDHAQYREYASAQGHWMSPDPYSGSYDWANPQSLNRYAYVLNGPLSSMDASGLCPLCLSFYFWNEGAQTLQVFALSPVVVGLVAGGVALGALVVDELGKWLGWWSSNFNGVAGSPRPDVPNKSPCANDTLAQAGVDARQQITQAQGAMLNSPGPFGTISAYAGPVGTGGPNDIKNLPGHSPQNSIDVAVGNISYGITCPFEAGFCQFAAGLAQTFGGNPDFNGSFKTGFDTPADNAQIRTGQAMRAAGCRE